MSADELLPVLAFILAHANIPNLSSEVRQRSALPVLLSCPAALTPFPVAVLSCAS